MRNKKKEPDGGRFSVTELIRAFMEHAADHAGKKWLPSLGEPLWQDLLYRTWHRTETLGMTAASECMGRFEYNGPYPKISGWSAMQSAIRHIINRRASDGKVALIENLPRAGRTPLLQEVVEMMFAIASDIHFFRE